MIYPEKQEYHVPGSCPCQTQPLDSQLFEAPESRDGKCLAAV